MATDALGHTNVQLQLRLRLWLPIYVRGIYICELMKTMSPPNYHQNELKKTHALGHMMYGCINHRHMVYVSLIYEHRCMGTLCTSTWCTWVNEVAQVHELPKSHCGDCFYDFMYILLCSSCLLLQGLSSLHVMNHLWSLSNIIQTKPNKTVLFIFLNISKSLANYLRSIRGKEIIRSI